MSKKLLTESEIERFKRLAGLPSKSGTLNESYEYEELEEAEEEEMEDPEAGGDEPPMGDEAGAPEDMEMGAGDDEMAPPEGGDELGGDMGAEGAGGKEETFKNIVMQLADLIGVEVDVGEDAGAEEPDMGDLGGDEEGGDEEELDMSAGDEEGADEEEPSEEEDAAELNESLINSVVNRVAARLVAEAKKEKVKKKIKEGATKGAAKGHGAGKGFKVKKLGNEYSLADKGDPRKAKKANDGGNQTVVAKGGTKAKELPHGAKKKGTGTGKNAQTN